jgi:phage replication O-like protein O
MKRIESPNYTQIPNIVLDSLRDLTESETKIMLVICRQTFGWHRGKSKLSRSTLSAMTGISDNSVKAGIDGLMARHWVSRHPEKNSFNYAVNLEEIQPPEEAEMEDEDPSKFAGETPQNLPPLEATEPLKICGGDPSKFAVDTLKICGENPSKFAPHKRKKESSKENRKKESLSSGDFVFPSHLQTDAFRKVWEEWIQLRSKLKSIVGPKAFFQRQIDRELTPLSEEQAIACVEKSLSSQWRGLFPEKFANWVSPDRPAPKGYMRDESGRVVIDHSKGF